MCGMKPEQNVAAQRSPAEEPWEDLMFLTASDTQELQLRRTEEFQNPGRCLGSGQPCDPHGGGQEPQENLTRGTPEDGGRSRRSRRPGLRMK